MTVDAKKHYIPGPKDTTPYGEVTTGMADPEREALDQLITAALALGTMSSAIAPAALRAALEPGKSVPINPLLNQSGKEGKKARKKFFEANDLDVRDALAPEGWIDITSNTVDSAQLHPILTTTEALARALAAHINSPTPENPTPATQLASLNIGQPSDQIRLSYTESGLQLDFPPAEASAPKTESLLSRLASASLQNTQTLTRKLAQRVGENLNVSHPSTNKQEVSNAARNLVLTAASLGIPPSVILRGLGQHQDQIGWQREADIIYDQSDSLTIQNGAGFTEGLTALRTAITQHQIHPQAKVFTVTGEELDAKGIDYALVSGNGGAPLATVHSVNSSIRHTGYIPPLKVHDVLESTIPENHIPDTQEHESDIQRLKALGNPNSQTSMVLAQTLLEVGLEDAELYQGILNLVPRIGAQSIWQKLFEIAQQDTGSLAQEAATLTQTVEETDPEKRSYYFRQLRYIQQELIARGEQVSPPNNLTLDERANWQTTIGNFNPVESTPVPTPTKTEAAPVIESQPGEVIIPVSDPAVIKPGPVLKAEAEDENNLTFTYWPIKPTAKQALKIRRQGVAYTAHTLHYMQQHAEASGHPNFSDNDTWPKPHKQLIVGTGGKMSEEVLNNLIENGWIKPDEILEVNGLNVPHFDKATAVAILAMIELKGKGPKKKMLQAQLATLQDIFPYGEILYQQYISGQFDSESNAETV